MHCAVYSEKWTSVWTLNEYEKVQYWQCYMLAGYVQTGRRQSLLWPGPCEKAGVQSAWQESVGVQLYQRAAESGYLQLPDVASARSHHTAGFHPRSQGMIKWMGNVRNCKVNYVVKLVLLLYYVYFNNNV